MEKFSFEYEIFNSWKELTEREQEIVSAAFEAAEDLSYAPYSQFKVGASIILSNNKIIKGGNQENAAYPAGICAERVALSAVSAIYPRIVIKTIAIAYRKNSASNLLEDKVLSPCGICRQSILEYQNKQSSPIGLLLCSETGKVIKVLDAKLLLPFSFSGDML